MKNKCELCKKDRKKFNGFVWYSSSSNEKELCRSCYLKWCRSKDCKSIEEKFKNAKPTTNKWKNRCDKLQEKFNEWFGKRITELKKHK